MFLHDMEQRVRELDQLELCRRRCASDVELHVNSVNCSQSTRTTQTTRLSLKHHYGIITRNIIQVYGLVFSNIGTCNDK